jgi:hypothetical protein
VAVDAASRHDGRRAIERIRTDSTAVANFGKLAVSKGHVLAHADA